MTAAASPGEVAADACFLINFLAVDRMDLLGGLNATYRFFVPLEVLDEILRKDEKARLAAALKSSVLQTCEILEITEMTSYTELLGMRLGSGEAAALAIASQRAWRLASDERGRFLRTAVDRIGQDRILTTPLALSDAIRTGLIDGADARAIATELRNRHRFAMAIPDEW